MAKIIKNKQVEVTSDWSFGSNKLLNLGTPTSDNDAANKAYVDSVAQGLDPKESCVVGTTANVDLSTGGLLTIDGYTLSSGDRVMVKSQTDNTENGIYVAAAGAWSRSEDMDGTPANEVSKGNFTFVESGNTLVNTGWVVTSDATGSTISIGVDSIIWVQFSSAGIIEAGDGIDKTGNVISVDLNGNTLGVGAAGLSIAADYSSTVAAGITSNANDISTNASNIASNAAVNTAQSTAIVTNANSIASVAAVNTAQSTAISSLAAQDTSNTLSGLTDVDMSLPLEEGDTLVYSGGSWTNVESIDIGSLGYATTASTSSLAVAVSSNANDISTNAESIVSLASVVSSVVGDIGVQFVEFAPAANAASGGTGVSAGVSLTENPAADCYIQVEVNGIGYSVGYDSAGSNAFYFSGKQRTELAAGDVLSVHTTNLGFGLDTDDEIRMIYSVKASDF